MQDRLYIIRQTLGTARDIKAMRYPKGRHPRAPVPLGPMETLLYLEVKRLADAIRKEREAK